MSVSVWPRGDVWVVVDDRTHEEVASHANRSVAFEHAKELNARACQVAMGSVGLSQAVTGADQKRGCNCFRGVALPDDPACPVHDER